MKATLTAIRRYLASIPWLFTQPALLVWAIVVGVAGAYTTIAFEVTARWVQRLHSGADGDVVAIAMQWSVWQKILIPTLGAFVAGCLLAWATRLRVDTNSDYMEAVAIGDGRISLRQGFLRVMSSLSVVATGGSLGREGPIIHLAAMFASLVGRLFQLDFNRLRFLVACGAAAGVAAAYHAPIAGALFIAEIVLGTMAMHILGPLMLSSATAYIVMRFMGYGVTLYEPPQILYIDYAYCWWLVLLLGVMAGILAPQFLRFLDFCRRCFSLFGVSLVVRLTISGFLLGCLFVYEPWVAGKGDSVIRSFLSAEWTWQAVLILLALKLLATGLSVGSGAVGGVITPVMFVGAGLAMVLVQALGAFLPELLPYSPLLIFVGMGAFLAAATSAPLMAVMLIFEMTHSTNVIVPLMLACVLAYFVSRSITGVVMFTITGDRDKNDEVRRELSKLRVNSMIHPTTTALTTGHTVRDALNLFIEEGLRFIYIINEEKEFLGAIAHKDITSLLLIHQDLDAPISVELIQRTYIEPLKLNMNLDEVQDRFVNFSGERLPVVDLKEPAHFLGVVYKSDVLRKYSEIKRIQDLRGESVVDVRGVKK